MKFNTFLCTHYPCRFCVRVVSSNRAGMGKTLFITRMAKKLQQVVRVGNVHIRIPIHGPCATVDSIMKYLLDHQNITSCTILHFNISSLVYTKLRCINFLLIFLSIQVLWQVDTILFSLLILRHLCNSQGHVWRSNFQQLIVLEVTLPETEVYMYIFAYVHSRQM